MAAGVGGFGFAAEIVEGFDAERFHHGYVAGRGDLAELAAAVDEALADVEGLGGGVVVVGGGRCTGVTTEVAEVGNAFDVHKGWVGDVHGDVLGEV